ncbi:hypothetical protein POM88_020398 [Heracleum sosnowskyi]|uniref:Histidine-containing phosphotransfer protein n=1 Tax=Heracleum sosnowskyi TaxID=360622 RepID=A0AAD8IDU2_9APIA|nr:hypothetical protein POM88_020397 [Heracleum sosnowskyi]KAK1382663.1 hypothetical protein POM88_020398 [Heracleum sosnowskyi]
MAENIILARIRQLETMGLVNGQLEEWYAVFQTDEGNSFFAELFRLFYETASRLMEKIEDMLNDNVVDFGVLLHVCYNLKDTFLSVGAVRVESPCSELCDSCQYRSASWCVSAIHEIRCEYLHLKAYIDDILQLL